MDKQLHWGHVVAAVALTMSLWACLPNSFRVERLMPCNGVVISLDQAGKTIQPACTVDSRGEVIAVLRW